jgi:hypothetical protein
LTLLTLASAVHRYFKKTPWKIWTKFTAYARENFIELSFIIFVLYYGYLSITGNLNLGIRHLFPIIPIISILVAKETVDWIKEVRNTERKNVYAVVLAFLLVWYGLANLLAFPYYVSYFNELVGGPGQAYKYVTDSNVDWGQDLKRLKTYVDSNPQIQKIAVDYFGGGDPRYYFCDRKYDPKGNLIANSSGYDCDNSKFVEWHAENGRWEGEYIAVSETFLMNDLWWSPLRGDEGYAWLRLREPIAKIGYSIYVYKLQ